MTDGTASETPPLDERLEIETPERVEIVFDLAGIGSRFAAGTLDVILLLFAFFVLFAVFALASGLTFPATDEERMSLGMAALGAFLALFWGYYLGFELLWNGQTPGKRWLRLRVRTDEGGPAPAGAILVRNILRPADLFPGAAPYGLGGIVMFLNRRAKRIGDYAAGTVVVREGAAPLRLDAVRERPAPAVPGEALDEDESARVRTFLTRRRQLMAARRAEIARAIAGPIAERHGLDAPDPERLLELLGSGRSPREIRDAQGPRP